MEKKINKPEKPGLKKIVVSLFWIIAIALLTLAVMMWISPDAKALPVFLIGFFVVEIIIVLIALYINYAVNIYKQLKKDN